MEVRVREQRLPGVGNRYELDLPDGRRLFVVVMRDGRRTIGLHVASADEPDLVATLGPEHAMTLAALLMGARFSVDTAEPERLPADQVVVETVTLGPDSPAVGRPMAEIPLPADAEAAVLAVISDDTPELVEDPVTRPCRPGDRVVVAARRALLASVARELAGRTGP